MYQSDVACQTSNERSLEAEFLPNFDTGEELKLPISIEALDGDAIYPDALKTGYVRRHGDRLKA